MQSIQVKDALPEPIANNQNIDSFVSFIEDYYNYMNLDNSPSREIAAIPYNKDIDLASEKYLNEIELLIAKYIPRSKKIDRERLLKIINNYYKIRGTEEGTKLFFKLFFDQDVDILYPRERVLNLSDGAGKYKNYSLKTITLEDGSTLDIKNIIELNDNEDRRVYGQYEYNENLKLYENIGKRVPLEYLATKEANTQYGSFENQYLGTNVAISGSGKITAVADQKGNVSVYRNTGGTLTKLGATLKGQSAAVKNITFIDNTDEISLTAHGLNTGDEISFSAITNLNGLEAEKIYYVIRTDFDKFKVSKTPGSTPIIFSTTGTATAKLFVYKKFGYAMAFNFDGTKLLISEPGYSTSATEAGVDMLLEDDTIDILEEDNPITSKELEGPPIIPDVYYSGRVILYEYNSKSDKWAVATKGNSVDDSDEKLIFYGNSDYGDDTAFFGHSVALNTVGDSIAISSIKHTGGENLDYVLSYKYKNNPEVWQGITTDEVLDTVTLTSHGFQNGDRVMFIDMQNFGGISERKAYYIVEKTDNNFKLSYSPNGVPIDLFGNGTAKVYVYKQSWQPHGLFPINTSNLKDVSFNDTAETITLNNHGFNVGDEVIFNTILGVDGLNTRQIYYIKEKTAHTFKLSAILNGPLLTFKNDGTGKILPKGTKLGKIINFVNGEDFGWSLAFNNTGTRLAIGIPGASFKTFSRCGKIDVYDYNEKENWVLVDDTSLYGTKFAGERYGHSLALSGNGNIIVGGAPYRAGTRTAGQKNVGCVVSYIWKGQYWKQYGKTPLYGTYVESLFGYKISLDYAGTRMALSAPGREISFGDAEINTYSYIHIYEFITNKDSWVQSWVTLEKKIYDLYLGYGLAMSSDGSKLIFSTPYNVNENYASKYINGSNILFTVDGNLNGKPKYVNGNQTISYNGTQWKWTDGTNSYFAYFGDEPFPWLASWPISLLVPLNIAGTSMDFTIDDIINGKPSYKTTTRILFYTGTRWRLTDNNGSIIYSADPGNQDFPWLATWKNNGSTITFTYTSWKTPVNSVKPQCGSVDFYNITKIDNSFSSDRSTRISTIRETIDGVQRNVWHVYDIYSETVTSGYRYSYISPPDGGFNPKYIYSTLEYSNISDGGDYEPSTTETVVTKYYRAKDIVLDAEYSILGNVLLVTYKNHGYNVDDKIYLDFTSGELGDDDRTINDSSIIQLNGRQATVNLNNHGLISGNMISVSGNTNAPINVTNAVITVVSKDVFTYQTTVSGSGEGVGTTIITIKHNAIFTVSAITSKIDAGDTLLFYTTDLSFNTIKTGDVTFLAPSPIHPYDIEEWEAFTTPSFNYTDTVKVLAAADDIRWVKSNDKGFLSDKYKLQDSYYWQNHSYEIKTRFQAAEWKDEYLGFCHPMGFELFSIFEIIDFAENDWVEYVKYFSATQRNAAYIPPRIRDIIKYPTLLPEGMSELLSGRGQHTPRSQPGRGLDRDLLLIIFGKMFDDLGKTYTLKTEFNQGNYILDKTNEFGTTFTLKNDYPNQIVYTRNLVRMLYAYLQLYIDSKYIRGQDAKYLKFLGDDIDSIDNIEYKKSGSTQAYIYNTTQKLWETYGQKLFGDFADDMFGASVSINSTGNRIAISMPGNDNLINGELSNIGAVKVYEYRGGEWLQIGNTILGDLEDEKSGWNITLNAAGDRIVIASDISSLTSGATDQERLLENGTEELVTERGDVRTLEYKENRRVRVFEYKNDMWVQLGQDLYENILLDDILGYNISIDNSGNRIALGAIQALGESGYVKVYNYNNTSQNWEQYGNTIDGEANGDLFGSSLELNGDGSRIVVGAPFNGATDSGSVRVYSYSAGTWTQLGLDLDGSMPGDNFGTSVAINNTGDRIAVGIPYSDFIGDPSNRPNRGLIKVYKFEFNAWTQLGQDIEGELYDGNGGYDIAFDSSGNKLVIGTPNHFGGHAKVYELIETFGLPCPFPRWMQVGNDVYGDIEYYENGKSVAINSAGNIILVGENGGNERVKKSDGQSIGNGLMHLTPDEYMNIPTATSASRILNFPTNVTLTTRALKVDSVPSTTSVNEGSSVIFNITTEGVRNANRLYYTTTAQSQILNPTGDFQILANSGSFTINVATDSIDEPSEQFVVAIRTKSITGPIIHWTQPVTIL
jgi:hypothetical protein